MLRRLAASLLDRVATRFENALDPFELRRWVRVTARDGVDDAELPIITAERDAARAWGRRTATTRKFPKEPLPRRLGLAFDALAIDGEPMAVALEVLLRHVELRRAGCLSEWVRPTTANERECERLDVATLFVRTTARTGDWRYINAALKMLDWFGSRYIRDGCAIAPAVRRALRRTAVESIDALDRATSA